MPPGTNINDIHILLCCIAVVLNQPLCKLLVSTPKAGGFNTNSLNGTGYVYQLKISQKVR